MSEAPPGDVATPGGDARFSAYQRRLFVFLGVAGFFEGYDQLAITQILPNLRAELGLGKEAAGLMLTVINVGTVLAYLLVRRADAWGRRRVLTATIAGYTLFTFLTGFAPDVWTFTALQLVARVFLIGEWAVSMVVAAEEFSAARRGMVIGVISATGSLGAVFCAGIVPLLLKLPSGWRSVYFVGIAPLLLLAYARRGLRETRRFEQQAAAAPAARSLLAIWRTPYRGRLIEVALVWGLTYVCTQNAVTFWKEFAVAERGMSDGEVGRAISIAAVGSMPFVFAAGRLLDQVGRRVGALLIFVLGSAGVFGSYTLHGTVPLVAALTLGIFGVSAMLPVLNAFTTELFPTEQRADAFAWANNLLGRVTYVLSPTVVAVAAAQVGWGPAVAATALFPLAAVAMIVARLPETRGRELEETALL